MKTKLYNWIINNVHTTDAHPQIQDLPSVTTYARELGLYTACYIPFELKTDAELLTHLTSFTRLRPPYFRNSKNLITKQPMSPNDFILQNRQHRLFLTQATPDQTFIIDNGILVETKPNISEDLLTKKGIIAKNHLTRTVTYSAHAVAIPDVNMQSITGVPHIGIPKHIFNRLHLKHNEPVMFLRNPVIKSDGVHFAFPVPTDNTHAISIHPYFCSGMNLDFDGDMIQVYRIMHPENIAKAISLITTRYPNPLPNPTNKDFALINARDNNIPTPDGLSLQDYIQNTPAFQAFLKAKPSKKVSEELSLSAKDLTLPRTPEQFAQHLTQSSAYKGLFQAKADIGKTGGLYKKLVYAFPNHIKEIMEIVEPLSQATLDQKHTLANFSVDRIVNAFNNLEEPSNFEYILENTPQSTHEFITYLHNELNTNPLAIRHKNNMPFLTYLGTKFTPTFPSFHNSKPSDNIFHFLQSLNAPTHTYLPISHPTLPELTEADSINLYADYLASLINKSEQIPQKYLDPKSQNIYEHRFNKTLVDKTNPFSEYLTSQMVSVPHDDNNLYLLPPKGFCPYQRTEKDPEALDPITFIPNFPEHTTSATPLNIPYLRNTEHARLVYACNNIKQALQLRNPEEPLCRTKYHRTLKIGVNLLATFLAHPDVYEDAVVISQSASEKLTTVTGSPAQPGDKLTGRHGNKAVISRVIPDAEMPIDPRTLQPTEIIFSPLSVTSRKNFGFLAEIQSNIHNNNQPHIETPINTLINLPNPALNNTLTGYCYILRNRHTAEHGTETTTLPQTYTQFLQPANGETISLNHIYALEVLGLRSLIAEFFSFRSNQDQIENNTQNLYQEPLSIQVLRTLYVKLTSQS